MLGFELSMIWAGLIAFAILAYVILDGFDLGTGILFPFLGKEDHRAHAMNTIAPVWDGNETWLVLGGGGLFAVFPLAYAIVMPALYPPVIAMLLALIFRGVAFEFRHRNPDHEKLWDVSFFFGSLVATLSQGLILGALVQGIEVENRAYAGGYFDWFTPFSVLTAVALVAGYALLGATWLVMKTTGFLRDRARFLSWVAAFTTLVLVGAVSLATPFLDVGYMDRWFSRPNVFFTMWVPTAIVLAAFLFAAGMRKDRDTWPFLSALAIFVLSFIGLGISLFPYMVPHSVTIAEAAAPDDSLWFLLAGALVLIPMILGYTAYAYWVFRGKTDPSEGYH